MTPNEYQRLAERTESDPQESLRRMNRIANSKGIPSEPTRVTHSLLGITSEAGELADAIKKWFYYGQELDRINIKEELGDLLWYIALMCNTLGLSLEEVMVSNIAKLKVRYPDKFTEELAKEENRDRDEEKKKAVGNKPKFIKEFYEKEIREICRNEVARNVAEYISGQDRKKALEYIERMERSDAETGS